MSNFKKLALYFVYHNGRIIDGDDSVKNIINHMIRLNKITFNIRSIILRGNQIISCINYFPKTNECHCYIYSYSYTLTYYNDITNNFPGGLFKCVRKVSLYDECPFEYEFFLQIAQSFPFMKKLTVHKRKSQNNDNQQWSIIECFHLTELDLVRTHENYIEEFIINNKTHLLNNVTLHITYKSSQRITHNFTGDATRINCSKIDYIVLYSKPEFFFFEYLKDYFPHAEIVWLLPIMT